MTIAHRDPVLAVLALALALAGCECGSTPVGACTNSDECPTDQYCVDSRCRRRRGVDAAVDAPPLDAPADDAATGDVQCPVVESSPVATRVPIDVILLVDGSGSTGSIPMHVQREVESNLRVVLEAASIDYHIVLISSCDFALAGLPAGRYARFPLLLGSGDPFAFRPLLLNYASRDWASTKSSHQTILGACVSEAERAGPGWQALMRPEARKVFIHFTDSAGWGERIDGFDGTFDVELSAMDPAMFGTVDAPRFTYHAFLGLGAGAAPDFTLYCPDEAIVTSTCTGPFRDPPGSGGGFQAIARRMRGYRAPICGFDRYDEVFGAIAASTVAYAQDCTFELPETPLGFTLNLDAIAVRYTTMAGRVRDFRQVPSAAECGEDRFYLDRTTDPARVTLCPEACDLARSGFCDTVADPLGMLTVRFACDPSLI